MKIKLKIGDSVRVITGEKKGNTGTIVAFFSNHSQVLLDTLVNTTLSEEENKLSEEKKKKRLITKAKSSALSISNVMAWEKEKQSTSKIGYKIVDGKKKRYFKKSGTLLN